MARSRYSTYTHIQPIRKILPALTDIEHIITAYETVDQLALKYYNDSTLEFIIMCANPEFFMSFDIPAGSKLRIPFPLTRVYQAWGEAGEV